LAGASNESGVVDNDDYSRHSVQTRLNRCSLAAASHSHSKQTAMQQRWGRLLLPCYAL